MSSTFWGVGFRPAEILKRITLSAVVALSLPAAHWCMAQAKQPKPNPFAKPEDESKPDPIPEFKLDRVLPTIPIPHDRPAYNFQMRASLHHRDNQGIWFPAPAFKPPIKTSTSSARLPDPLPVLKVVNRTGKADVRP